MLAAQNSEIKRPGQFRESKPTGISAQATAIHEVRI